MKTLIRALLVLVVLGGLVAAAYRPAMRYWKERTRVQWRHAEVVRGDLTSVVNATGEVKPVVSVDIGSFVSGPITELEVDFNEEVPKDKVLARIDPRIYEAAVKRDNAVLETRKAEVRRVNSLLEQATRDEEERAVKLKVENEDFISQAEMDQLFYRRESLKAERDIAMASVTQAEANLENSKANLEYTYIRSPVAGIIIDRKIDPGQTLAVQFQTPVLFTVAPGMREKMHVHAMVDEADIGRIRAAQEKKQPVHFTIDAYIDDLFEGQIEEVRFSPTMTQNVVTYPVIVAATNPELKLLPGMTASISFQVDQCQDVLKIPNAALRFFPKAEQVREEDRPLLEGVDMEDEEEDDEENASLSALQRSEARRKRTRRHVWVVEGELLKAIEVETGLSDNRYTELIEGDLKENQQLVTGIQPK